MNRKVKAEFSEKLKPYIGSLKPIQVNLKEHKSLLLLITTGFLLYIAFVIFVVISRLNRSTLVFEVLYFVPFITYCLVIFTIKKYRLYDSYNFLKVIFIFVVLFQLLILSTAISLSDDIYRFYMEGKAIISGINPYSTPIEDFPAYLKDDFSDKVNNADITSPYPPFALLIFAFIYLIGQDPIIFRLTFSISFLISILVCDRLIPYDEKWKLVIYSWNPLIHIEIANGSHFESIIILVVILSILSIHSNHSTTAGTLFLFASLLKYYPFFLVLLYWNKLDKKGKMICILGFSLYLIYILVDPEVISGVISYANDFYFNAFFLWVLSELTQNFNLAKVILGIIFITILVVLLMKSDRTLSEASRNASIILGLLILFQPSFHPWYFLWLFPFILINRKTPYSWILLSGFLILSYHVYITYDVTQEWNELILIRLLEFIPFFLLLLIQYRRNLTQMIKDLRYKKNKEEIIEQLI
ncbi:MAG: hypothetical protein ACFFAU_00235 [Candidatus Hodarchaeota archaeon]